ncbi:MAG: hypothetical protein WCO29_07020 [Nostocales cyanobacterium ELA583]
MNTIEKKTWMMQAEYAKKLRPLLPPEAFLPDINKLWILLINLAIMILGWGIANYLDDWNWYFLWLYLPLALVMGNSVNALLFSTHNCLHSRTITSPWL